MLYIILQVWRDLKSNTSKKASKLRNEKNRTGNFPINAEPLDKLEKRVIGCMGLEYVQGASNRPDSTPEEEVQLTSFCIPIVRYAYQLVYFPSGSNSHITCTFLLNNITVI